MASKSARNRNARKADVAIPRNEGEGGSNGRAVARTTIAVQGARVHNLKNISLEIPRDRLIVVTGLTGSSLSLADSLAAPRAAPSMLCQAG